MHGRVPNYHYPTPTFRTVSLGNSANRVKGAESLTLGRKPVFRMWSVAVCVRVHSLAHTAALPFARRFSGGTRRVNLHLSGTRTAPWPARCYRSRKQTV